MPIRLIAVDIDGTLLDNSARLPEANRYAIEAAVARGIEVALVTGRRFESARGIAGQMACPLTMIVNNGALVKSADGATHLRRLLPRETAREVLGLLGGCRRGMAVIFDRPRANQVIFEEMDWEDPQRRNYYLRNRDFIAQVRPLEDCLVEDPIEVMHTGPISRIREAEAALRARADGAFSLAVTRYDDRDAAMMDVLAPKCSKGAALSEWAARRGLRPEEIMAIGDNRNDLEMLEFAGLPVVMGNGVPEIKRRGWRETGSNDAAGVAAAIEAWALGAP